MIGKTLGQYQVRELLGAGAMGEVYLAFDSRLHREVALKVLPESLAGDAGRKERLEHEARALASLNHVGIAAIHGLEEADGRLALVLELVEGQTLADRLAGGAVPVKEALAIAQQLAAALEAAHDAGIVHRDLKPANIKLRSDGTVKVLDFGLAKVLHPLAGEAAADAATVEATREGEIVGTIAYMPPEQLRGQPIDSRADVWAFGCVLYEMLAGQRPFAGPTASDTVARLLEHEPDWTRLPQETPPSIRRLLRRCLRKDRRDRLRHIGDALLEIVEPESEGTAPQARSRPRAVLVAATAIALLAVAWGLSERRAASRVAPPAGPAAGLALELITRAEVNTEAIDAQLGALLALASDASRIVYVARDGNSSLLYEHPLDGGDPRPIAGTGDAQSPALSPDGRSVAFRANGRLREVRLDGSAPRDVGPAGSRSRFAWLASGDLLAAVRGGITRYTAAGEAVRLVSPDAEVAQYGWPFPLPDGEHMLVAARAVGGTLLDDPSQIRVVALGDGSSRVLVERGGTPAFLPAQPGARRGHLLYALEGTVWAAPFDVEGSRLLGPAVAAVTGVMMRPNGDAAQYAVADNGTLIYLSSAPGNELVWVDAAGAVTPASSHHRPFAIPRLAPDGRSVALEVHEGAHAIWVLDLERDTLGRFSYEDAVHYYAWAGDGRSMLYTVSSGGNTVIAWKRVGVPGPGEIILADDARRLWVTSWSADGRVAALSSDLNEDVYLVPLTPGEPPRVAGELIPVAVSGFTERDPMVRPDGECVAYTSNETGSTEVYVSCPAAGERVQVSSGGAKEPQWSPDGTEVYFRSEDRLMRARVTHEPSLRADRPELVHAGNFLEFDPANYDVTPDGRRVLRLREADAARRGRGIVMRFGWQRELQRIAAPAGQ